MKIQLRRGKVERKREREAEIGEKKEFKRE